MKTAWIAAAAACLLAQPASAQQFDFSKAEIKTTDLGHGVYLLSWPVGDSVLLTGPDGALLVDTSVPQFIDKIRAAVAKVSGGPVRYVINAHAHADHFGGNEAMARAGAVIIAQENVRNRMARGWTIPAFNQTIPPQPPAALPSLTYADHMTIHFDGETIELIHVPAAHTDSDSIIWFREANVVHIGGAFGAGSTYPFYDLATGGSLDGVIAAQERVLAISDDSTRIIADEGAPEGKAQLKASHDMLVTLRGRVQKLIDQGLSEDQAVAAKPAQDLDATFAPKGAFLRGDLVVRMAYQSLKGAPAPAPAN